jgi:hypothetical protein
MSVSNKLRVAMNPAELFLIARIATVLLILPASLKLLNINRITRMLTPRRTRTPPEQLSPERITYLCLRVLTLFGRISYRSNCLRRCLLLFHCLRYHGKPVVIHFGVKPSGEDLVGHCWLTLDGVLYHDRIEMVSQFTHMFSLPSPAPVTGSSSEGRTTSPDLRTVSFDA